MDEGRWGFENVGDPEWVLYYTGSSASPPSLTPRPEIRERGNLREKKTSLPPRLSHHPPTTTKLTAYQSPLGVYESLSSGNGILFCLLQTLLPGRFSSV